MLEGIVLVRIPIREHDEVISLITRHTGRVDILAKGIKKITSKLSPHLEPFSHISFDTAQGKEMSVLTVAQPIERFLNTRVHYVKSLQAEFAAYALYKLTRPDNVEHGIFELFYTWLHTLNQAPYVPDCRFLDWFMFQLIRSVGFEPAYSACVFCDRLEDLSFWSFSQGGVVCSVCASHNREANSLFRVSSAVLKDLARIHHEQPATLLEGPAFVPGVHSILTGHLQYQTEATIGNWAHTCLLDDVTAGKLA